VCGRLRQLARCRLTTRCSGLLRAAQNFGKLFGKRGRVATAERYPLGRRNVMNLAIRNGIAALACFGIAAGIDFAYIRGFLEPIGSFVLLPAIVLFVLFVPIAFLRANESPDLPPGDPKDRAVKRMILAVILFVIVAAYPLFELHYLMGGRN